MYALSLSSFSSRLVAALCGLFLVTDSLSVIRAAEASLPRTVAPGAELVAAHVAPQVFFEGPSWDPHTQSLLFTAFTADNQQILRLSPAGEVSLWLDQTEGVNGTYLSTDGRLLGSQAFGHRVMSYGIGPDGPTESLALVEDATLNQPNDICQTPNGDIYFTDPDFDRREKSAVYVLQPGGTPRCVIDDMPVPNGVIAANDGRTLYVGDSHLRLWRAYPIQADGGVGEGSVFFNPETENMAEPDGMSIDEEGNLYLSGRGGVWVASPQGECLGLIPVPEFCSNVTFGGADGQTLYLTCQDKLYSLQMTVRGGQFAAE